MIKIYHSITVSIIKT